MAEFQNHQNTRPMVCELSSFHMPITRTNWIAGYTYCAIAALSFLGRLPNSQAALESAGTQHGLRYIPETIRWLVSRQSAYVDDEQGDEDESGSDPYQKQREAMVGIYSEDPTVGDLSLEDKDFVGFNGRCNKSVDTCYAFWVGASLDVGTWQVLIGNIQLNS